MPIDVPPKPTQDDWNNLGWQSFVALNWPSVVPATPSGISGKPDSTVIGAVDKDNNANIPTVWLTYRTASSTFLSGAVDPGAWASPTAQANQPIPPTPLDSTMAVAKGFQPMSLDRVSKLKQMEKKFSTQLDEVNEATGNPLIDQAGRYVLFDVRLNESEHTYIRTNKYYDVVDQAAAFPAGEKPTFVDFPKTGTEPMFDKTPLEPYAQSGATEIKASWRVLDPEKDKDIMNRYYTQVGYFLQPDGKTVEGPAIFGLIGLHILRLTPQSHSTWFWATFEHVDNVSVPAGASFSPTLANPKNMGPFNVAPAPAATAGSGKIPWNNKNVPVNVLRVQPISGDIEASNKVWQSALAKSGSGVWQYYQMVGVMNPAVSKDTGVPIGGPYPGPNQTTPQPPYANTGILANTTMETYVFDNTPGQNSNCTSCHGFAFPNGAPQTSGEFQIFSFLLSSADSSDYGKAKPQGLPKKVQEAMRAQSKAKTPAH